MIAPARELVQHQKQNPDGGWKGGLTENGHARPAPQPRPSQESDDDEADYIRNERGKMSRLSQPTWVEGQDRNRRQHEGSREERTRRAAMLVDLTEGNNESRERRNELIRARESQLSI